MTENPDTNLRLTELEAKIAFQDDIIEKLNATIIEQWKQIESHARQISALNERLREAEQNATPARNEPPPHY
jgi:SlyX protein